MKWYHQSGLKRSYQQRQFLSCASTCNVVCDLQHVISQINADDVCVGCSLNIHDYGDNMPSFHSRNFAMTRALVVNCMCNTCWQHFHCLGVSLRLVITRNMMLKRVHSISINPSCSEAAEASDNPCDVVKLRHSTELHSKDFILSP